MVRARVTCLTCVSTSEPETRRRRLLGRLLRLRCRHAAPFARVSGSAFRSRRLRWCVRDGIWRSASRLRPAHLAHVCPPYRDGVEARDNPGASNRRGPTRFPSGKGDRPTFVGYCDRQTLRPLPVATGLRVLDASSTQDLTALDDSRRACTRLEWEHGGSTLGPEPAVGAFAGRTLAALAGYEIWGGRIAHIAVVAHPTFRGQGYARMAVHALVEHVLTRGLVPQYRTHELNAASVQLGTSIGFVPHATSTAVQMREAVT